MLLFGMDPETHERMNTIDERLWYGLVFQIAQCTLLAAIVAILLFFGHS